MVMDHLRSCYQTVMDFGIDPYRAVPIRWFFTAPGAKAFPGPHLFSSGNWTYDRIQEPDGVGEVKGAKPIWDNGNNANGKSGDHLCGDVSLYQRALSASDILPDGNCCPYLPTAVSLSVTVEGLGTAVTR